MTQRAVIVLGHGSRSLEATEQFLQVVMMLTPRLPGSMVVPAFMELSEPSLPDAVKRVAESGVTEVTVLPYFLFAGNHINHDIPSKLAEAAKRYPDLRFEVLEPIGSDPRMVELLLDRLHKNGEALWGDCGPGEIEATSMAIISAALKEHRNAAEAAVIKRLIHASGDLSLASAVAFSAGGAAAGVVALKGGATVVTDVRMVEVGIDSSRLSGFGGSTQCLIDDASVAAEALITGRTRAATAMKRLGSELDGTIVAIGNAPSALREVIALSEEGVARPALVIGVPVGFVDAAESKAALENSGLDYITVRGSRGGSPLAAAAVNALLRFAEHAEKGVFS